MTPARDAERNRDCGLAAATRERAEITLRPFVFANPERMHRYIDIMLSTQSLSAALHS